MTAGHDAFSDWLHHVYCSCGNPWVRDLGREHFDVASGASVFYSYCRYNWAGAEGGRTVTEMLVNMPSTSAADTTGRGTESGRS